MKHRTGFWKHHWLISFCCCSGRKKESFSFSDGGRPSFEHLPKFPDQLFRIFAGYVFRLFVESVCQRSRRRYLLVFKQQVFCPLRTFARTQQRLEIGHNGVRKGFCFLFQINRPFMEVVLLTLDPFKTCLKNSFFLAFVHTASLVSIFVFLAWFFRKRPLPFAHFENSLDSQANGNRRTGTPCLFAGKNDAFDSLQTPFPTVTTHFVIDIHTPPLGLVLHPAYRLSRISPLFLKTFFTLSQGSGFALLGTPTWLPVLCKPMWAAANCRLVSILFDPWHTHSGFEIWNQKSVILVDADVLLGHPDFVKARGQTNETKTYLPRQPRIQQSCA